MQNDKCVFMNEYVKKNEKSLIGLFKKMPYGAEFNLMDREYKYHKARPSGLFPHTSVVFIGIEPLDSGLVFELRNGGTITTDEYGVVEEGVYVFPIGTSDWDEDKVIGFARKCDAAKWIAEKTGLKNQDGFRAVDALVRWIKAGGIERKLAELPYAREEAEDETNRRLNSFTDFTKQRLIERYGSIAGFKEDEIERIMTAKAIYGVFGFPYGKTKKDIGIDREVENSWNTLTDEVKAELVNEYGSEENYKARDRERRKCAIALKRLCQKVKADADAAVDGHWDSLSEKEKAEIIEEFGSEENYKSWKRHTDNIMRKCLERKRQNEEGDNI